MAETALVPTQTELVQAPTKSLLPTSPRPQFTKEQVEIAKKQLIIVASNKKDDHKAQPTDDEAVVALAFCYRIGLDPFTHQIYCMKRYSQEKNEYKLSFEIGIDGFRLMALRNPKYDGQSAPQWCGPDGKWKDLWVEKDAPAAARVLIYLKGITHPFVGIATMQESAKSTIFWRERPAGQLIKCAEVNGLRRAFPQDFSGLYIPEEMPETDNGPRISEDIKPVSLPPISVPTETTLANKDAQIDAAKQQMLKKILLYMAEKKIPGEVVRELAKKPSTQMTAEELANLFQALKEGQEYIENHPNENVPLEPNEKLDMPPTAQDAPATFPPPTDTPASTDIPNPEMANATNITPIDEKKKL